MKHRNFLLPTVFSFLLLPFSALFAEENRQIQTTITSQEQVREEAAQQAVKDLLEKFVLNPDDTSIVYSEGCGENSTAEQCNFYRHVSKLGGCGTGEGLSSSQQEACLQKGLKKLYFFRDHDYLSFSQQKDQLKYRIKLFYFLDGNNHVNNRNGNDIYPVTLQQSATSLSITHFPLEVDPEFHYEKSKYFFNIKNLESAIEECSIAYNMDRNNKAYYNKLKWYMQKYSEENTGYDPAFALENIEKGYSPFYAQGNVDERNYLRPEFHKSNVSEPIPGTLTWRGSHKVEEKTPEREFRDASKKNDMPMGLSGVEILKFKFGEKEDLPERKPRQPDFENK